MSPKVKSMYDYVLSLNQRKKERRLNEKLNENIPIVGITYCPQLL